MNNRLLHFRRSTQRGFSVIEVMIAMLLSLTLGAAIITVFVNNSHSFDQDENLARMQDDARHALQEIAFELSMAGFYADLHMPHAITEDATLSVAVDCGPAGDVNWIYRTVDGGTDDTLSVTSLDNVGGADVTATYACFDPAEVLPGTDVVAIKRVAGGAAAGLVNDAAYLRTNGTVGLLYNAPYPAAPTVFVGPPNADWEFRPSIYYIRRFANAPGDNIPTLCRKSLQAPGPTMATECLAAGIENLQIEYGIDTSEDGHPNLYVSGPTLTDVQNVVSARVFLLARTTDIDTRYTNAKTFALANAPDYTPADSFHRRVFSTNVSIQNIRTLNMMGF